MKVKFNKLLTEDRIKTTVMNSDLDMYINHRKDKFKGVPFRLDGEWFSVSGKYETDEDDINIINLVIDDDEIELSDKDEEKVKEILSQLIWQHFLNLKDNQYDV